LEAEGIVLRAISVMLAKEDGMRSLIGRFAKCTTLLPNLPAIDVRLLVDAIWGARSSTVE